MVNAAVSIVIKRDIWQAASRRSTQVKELVVVWIPRGSKLLKPLCRALTFQSKEADWLYKYRFEYGCSSEKDIQASLFILISVRFCFPLRCNAPSLNEIPDQFCPACDIY